jgi:uncharacterized repeat protein (TIGR01451 family)
MRFRTTPGVSLFLIVFVLWAAQNPSGAQGTPLPTPFDPSPPAQPVRLIFIHHSTGENWLADDNGGLGLALRNNNYFVSDTNYSWGPADVDKGGTIGDHTDIPDWYSWFTGPHRDTYLAALYAEADQHSSYTRLANNPGGPNTIIMFKSCFPNSALEGNLADSPAASADNFSDLTVANAKRIYLDLLPYFAAHQDQLFVVIAAPPLRSAETTPEQSANARAFNNWLVDDWLSAYPHQNVVVFDFYTVLTSNGGNPNLNDLGALTGNHHRYRNGIIEHITNQGGNVAAYPTGDSHPSQAGNLKATGEFIPLLNIFYHRWQIAQQPPDLSSSTFAPDRGGVRPGERVTFTLALRNTGSISTSAQITSVVPGGLQYVANTLKASTGSASQALSPTLRWNGWVQPAQPVTITYAVTVTANTTQAISTMASIAPGVSRSALVIVNGSASYLPLIYKQ